MKPKQRKCLICKTETKYKYCCYQCQLVAIRKNQSKKKWHKSRGITKAKLDKLWSTRVKERDGKCIYCGKTDYLNAHHIFSRHNLTVRWLMENGGLRRMQRRWRGITCIGWKFWRHMIWPPFRLICRCCIEWLHWWYYFWFLGFL